jgi:hypothetical protein
MVTRMLSRRGKPQSRFTTRPSFAGRDLAERTRSTAFALLGAAAAVGLVLVALFSQQNWPFLPVGPIPGYHSEHGTLDDAISLASPPAGVDISAHPIARGAFASRGSATAGSGDSRLSGLRQVSSQPIVPSPATGQPHGESAPTPAPAGQPANSPPASAAAPTPPPMPQSETPEPPAPGASPPSPIVASVPGKGNAYGRRDRGVGKPNPSHPAPHSSPPPAAPVVEPPPAAVEAEPPTSGADAGSLDGPGNGHGHAYGHYK